jgi:membrane protein implicated in regulation of membrane protease activity
MVFQLAVGIGLILSVGFVVWLGLQPCFGCDRVSVLGVPSDVLMSMIAFLVALVGLVWMIRIFRGPRDEPPPWRYRDR